MTRKHFAAIAECLRYSGQFFNNESDYLTFCRLMGQTLNEFNDSFDMSYFMDACQDESFPVQQKGLF